MVLITANSLVQIRTAKINDAAQIESCVRSAYLRYVDRIGKPPAPMLDDYVRVISQRQVSVAERNDAIVGVLVLSANDAGFFLENVAVDPLCQGLGIGKTLLTLAESEARRQGFASINLYTHEKMIESRALYAKIGYVETRRVVELGYARIYMRKELA